MRFAANRSSVPARVVRGHRVASGGNGDARFPGGTLRMQMPHFLACGLDLAVFHIGTVNVSIAPLRYRVLRARTSNSKSPQSRWSSDET